MSCGVIWLAPAGSCRVAETEVPNEMLCRECDRAAAPSSVSVAIVYQIDPDLSTLKCDFANDGLLA